MAQLTHKEFELKFKEVRAALRTEVKAFPDNSPAAQDRRKREAEQDFKYYLATYLPHYFDTALSGQHKEMTRAVQTMERQVLIVAAGGWGKSTIVTLGYVLWCILFRKHHCIVIASMTEDIAAQATQLIKLELSDNERILEDFGSLQGRYQWSDNDFVTSNDIRVVARGAGQAFRGIKWRQYRPDLVVLDDIEDEEIASSSRRTAKTLNWVHSTVRPRMAATGWQLICVANLMGRSGVVGHMLYHPDYIAWKRCKFPSEDENGHSTWPAKWPDKKLKALKKEIGWIRYAREMLCAPVDDTHYFRPEMTHFGDPAIIPRLEDKIAYIDPSVLESRHGDFKSIIVTGKLPGDHREYVCGVWIRHATNAMMVGAAYKFDEDLHPRLYGLEANGFQRFLKRDFDDAAVKRGHFLPIKLDYHSEKKSLRIQRMVAPHDNGDLVFFREVGDTPLLLEQLYAFEENGGEHDDGPDSLSGAMEQRGGYRKKIKFTRL